RTKCRKMHDSLPLSWRELYCEAEFYKAAIRVYTKPLFQWRKALSTSTDGRNLYDMAARGLRGLDALHRALAGQSFAFRPALALHYNFNGKHRTLHLAPWEDRIVDLLIYRVLNRRLHARAGIPFGTASACLLANIALTDLDRAMEAVPGLAYFRYADDLLLLARERRMALDATERLETAIASLHLRCKPSHSVDLLMA